MFNFSAIILPLTVSIVIIYGLYHKVDIYDVFLEGAKESFSFIMTMFRKIQNYFGNGKDNWVWI